MVEQDTRCQGGDEKKQELIGRIELGVVTSISIKQAFQNYVDASEHNSQLESIKTHANKFQGKKRDTRRNAIEERFIDVYGFDSNRNFESSSMADMQQWVVARRKEGNSNSTILIELSTLSQTIKLNDKLGKPVPKIDFVALKKDNQLKAKKAKLRFLTKQEADAILAELHPDTIMNGIGALTQEDLKQDRQDAYDLTVMLLDTGGRYSEIAGLKWKDIDLRKRTVSIYRSKVDNESVLGMTNRMHQILTRRFHEKGTKQQHVFTAKDGGPRKYSPKSFNNACKRAGIKDVTLHTLRHTNASRLVQKGLSLLEVKEQLGHSSIQTTMIYAHLVPNATASKAVSMLDSFNEEA